jgi:hypothetical protein
MSPTVWQNFHNWQMLMGLIFTFTFRRAPILFSEWLGLGIVIIAISSSGVSSLLRSIGAGSSTTGLLFYSFAITILNCALSTVATGFEDELMRVKDVEIVNLVCGEGIWGCALIGFVFLPIANIVDVRSQLYECSFDVWQWFKYSPRLYLLEFGFVICFVVTHYLGIAIIQNSGFLRKLNLEAIRPIIICIVSYSSAKIRENGNVGEVVDSYSGGELFGVCLASFGALIYTGILKCPCFSYENEEEAENSPIAFIREDHLL